MVESHLPLCYLSAVGSKFIFVAKEKRNLRGLREREPRCPLLHLSRLPRLARVLCPPLMASPWPCLSVGVNPGSAPGCSRGAGCTSNQPQVRQALQCHVGGCRADLTIAGCTVWGRPRADPWPRLPLHRSRVRLQGSRRRQTRSILNPEVRAGSPGLGWRRWLQETSKSLPCGCWTWVDPESAGL